MFFIRTFFTTGSSIINNFIAIHTSFDVISITGTIKVLSLDNSGVSSNQIGADISITGFKSFTFTTVDGSKPSIGFSRAVPSGSGSIDNVSLKEVLSPGVKTNQIIMN